MAQFDLCRVRGGGLVVDCQSNLLSMLPTRFVAPLRPRDDSVMRRLTPVFQVDGKELAMITPLAGAIDARAITGTVMSLADREHDIKAALDMLIYGF